MKRAVLALFLVLACGAPPVLEQTASTSTAVSVWPTFPDVASHAINNSGQICQASCAAGAGAGNRCPCQVWAPPGARFCVDGIVPVPGMGETAVYVNEQADFVAHNTLRGRNCIILPGGIAYDYFWLALDGWESLWPARTGDPVPKGIVQAVLGPNTVLWFTSAMTPASAGSDGWTVVNYSPTLTKVVYPGSHGGCNVDTAPWPYTTSCDPQGDRELPRFPAYWIGSVFSEQLQP